MIDFKQTRNKILEAYDTDNLKSPIDLGVITWRLETTDKLIREQHLEQLNELNK